MQIGTQNVDTFEGEIIYPVLQTRKLNYAGEDGTLLIHEGVRERISQVITTLTCLDDAAADIAVESMRALIGNVNSVTDAFGKSHDNVYIDDLQISVREIVMPTTTETHTRQIVAAWKLIKRMDISEND